jgi:hypothetical protein
LKARLEACQNQQNNPGNDAICVELRSFYVHFECVKSVLAQGKKQMQVLRLPFPFAQLRVRVRVAQDDNR